VLEAKHGGDELRELLIKVFAVRNVTYLIVVGIGHIKVAREKHDEDDNHENERKSNETNDDIPHQVKGRVEVAFVTVLVTVQHENSYGVSSGLFPLVIILGCYWVTCQLEKNAF
jgi:hypothetical protein